MRKVLGVLFILLSTIVGVVVLISWGLRTSLLASEPWKASLREARVYDRVLVEALPEIVSDKSVAGNILEEAPLTPNDIIAVVQSTISAAFLQQQIEHGLDVVFDLLYSRTTLATADFVIPLQDVKRRLPVAVQERLVARVQALPICTTEQIKDFEKFKTFSEALPPCRPKGLDVQAIVRDSMKVDEIAANIPATFDVIAELQKQRSSDSSSKTVEKQQASDDKSKTADKKQDDGKLKNVSTQQVDEGEMKATEKQETKKEPSKTAAEQVATIQEKVQLFFQLHLYITLAWIVLLLGTGALFIPHWRRVAQWFAVSLFIPSVLVVAATLVAKTFVPDSLTMSERIAQVLANLAQPVINSLVQVAEFRLLIFGGAGAVMAIIIFTLAFSFRRNRLKV